MRSLYGLLPYVFGIIETSFCLIFRFLILCVFFANRVVFYAILVGFHRYHGVTHVFVNDPTRGYGIFAENMDNTLLTVAAASQSRSTAPAA